MQITIPPALVTAKVMNFGIENMSGAYAGKGNESVCGIGGIRIEENSLSKCGLKDTPGEYDRLIQDIIAALLKYKIKIFTSPSSSVNQQAILFHHQ